jgi:DNA-binding NarL/FixJ family response regulator
MRTTNTPTMAETDRRGSTPLRVALVNDYEIIVRGLHALLAPFGDRIVVVEHEIGGTPDVTADIALFDTFAGRRDAIERAAAMVREPVVEHVVLYTWDAPAEFLDSARAAEVSAVVLKSVDGLELVGALERIAAGERVGLDHVDQGPSDGRTEPLSVREREVLAMLALGLSNGEIARELFVSSDTIKSHVRRLFRKLGVTNRTQAALLAHRYELGPPSERLERFRRLSEVAT